MTHLRSAPYRTNRDLFSNHYLDEQLPEREPWKSVDDEEVREAYESVKSLLESNRDRVEGYNEAQLERNFIRKVFDALGVYFEIEETVDTTQRRPDYGFFETEDEIDEAFERRDEGGDFYENAVAVADAKRWGRKLDTRGEHRRDFENPSYQIHYYLQETPPDWAVLTNGEKWRLYYGPMSHRLDSYYEIDLPAVLDAVEEEREREEEDGDALKEFRYFYLFFRREAFVADAGGDCFLDDVYDGSNVFAQDLGEDLRDNIYEAIRVLSEGFLEYNDDLGEEDLDLIHDSSLIYLYRLIFVLYAESEGRELLPRGDEIYAENYSLNTLKQEVTENLDDSGTHYLAWEDNLWNRLDSLFRLIDQGSRSRGIPEDELFIPAYNGGLFRTNPDETDSDEARFLDEHVAGDWYVARVLDLLTRSSVNGGKTFVDYSSLDVRHLGSIYEGLLEYRVNVADAPMRVEDGEYVVVEDDADEDVDVEVQAGDVYLSTDSGERKATGSYYTPEYVVEYIVEETLGPLVDDVRESLVAESTEESFADDFAERVFEMKILDPAMGSGHFLVNAVDYLAREIINAQQRQDERAGEKTVAEERDINWARRQVAQKCIYGVDKNSLAVELSKVSLWLRTLAARQPLAFLDHHLKTGDSLVGSNVEEIDELETTGGDNDGPNSTLTEFGVTRRGTVEDLMRIYSDFIAIENQDLADIKEMEEKYDEFERNVLRRRLEAIANVKTAEEFGVDPPGGVYERMARALEDEDEWAAVEEKDWFAEAQRLAEEKEFFHWRLEFPEVFYDTDGEEKENPGFDAVIGNPPYGIDLPKEYQEYLGKNYISAGLEYDSYTFFLEKSISNLRRGGLSGYIIPIVWTKLEYNQALRDLMLSDTQLRGIVDVGDVFPDAVVETMILTFSKEEPTGKTEIRVVNEAGTIEDRLTNLNRGDWEIEYEVDQSVFSENSNLKIDYDTEPTSRDLISKVESVSDNLGELADISQGITPYDSYAGQDREIIENRAYHSKEKEDETYGKWLDGQDVSRYHMGWGGEWLSYGDWLAAPREKKYFTEPRLLFREVTGGVNRVIATYTEEEYYYGHSVIPAVTSDCRLSGKCLLAIVNSSLLGWYNLNTSPNAKKDKFPKMNPDDVANLPIYRMVLDASEAESVSRVSSLVDDYEAYLTGDAPAPKPDEDDVAHDFLAELAERMTTLKQDRAALNLSLLEYLGVSADDGLPETLEGATLGDLYMPVSGVSDTPLARTADELENARIGEVEVEDRDGRLVLRATARYKPENEDEHETDRWGYTETGFHDVMEFVGLDDAEEALVREFVPVAVEEAGGFAGFRETATKSNSLVDRLKALTLPDVDATRDDLDRYTDVKARADELDDKIERTDALIDEIVYDLYGLTDEEIEIVEEAVSD
ncbi:MAG: TaqI-like C-terminal specificity domain-containing protein [Halobacteriales archaeon]|nr:TaqI-like C-terminal specificity domain-containing protein [Halobacteriales archaeon]